jgi:6-phospho-3-hexuloisomerase
MKTTHSSQADLAGHAHAVVEELKALVAAVDYSQLEALEAAVLAAPRVFLSGSGRSGLISRALAMRLMHIGLASYAVGEAATPAIGASDLLIILSARGGASATAQVNTARSVAATSAAISSSMATAVAQAADLVLVVPARTSVPTRQHAGSLFEQGCLVIGDALCRAVQESRKVPTAALDSRHANLT